VKKQDKIDKILSVASEPNGKTNHVLKNGGNVLTFSCPHIPFEHKRYLNFLQSVQEEHDCETVVCLGDLFDNHAISYHEHDPDGHSAGKEFEIAVNRIKSWIYAFPNMYLCVGNHDMLPTRKAKTHGLPKILLKTYNSIWMLPSTWVWSMSYVKNDVKYMHGTGKTGMYMHKHWATENMKSTVTGHGHSNSGTSFQASHDKLLFGLGVGCGIDIGSYSMQYGDNFSRRPIVGCGVVKENGTLPIFIPMKL